MTYANSAAQPCIVLAVTAAQVIVQRVIARVGSLADLARAFGTSRVHVTRLSRDRQKPGIKTRRHAGTPDDVLRVPALKIQKSQYGTQTDLVAGAVHGRPRLHDQLVGLPWSANHSSCASRT